MPTRTPEITSEYGSTQLVTRIEAAALLSVHKVTISRLVHRGDLAGVLIGNRLRIVRASIDEYIARNAA